MAKVNRKHDRVGQVILFKRRNSPYWYMKYPHGTREIQKGKHAGEIKRKYRVESTGQTQLRQAQVIAQEIDLQLFKDKMGVCSGRITLPELRGRFLDHHENDTDNRFRHKRDLRGRTRVFVEWAASKGVNLASQVTLETAELFVRYLRNERNIEDRTVKNYVGGLRSMFSWAQGRQPALVTDNPFLLRRGGGLRITAVVGNRKSDDERYATYTPEQVKQLIETALACGDTRIADLITVLAETGMRFGELQFLTPQDIDWRKGRIKIGIKDVVGPLHPNQARLLDRHGRWMPKDETDRYIIMTPACYQVLEQALTPGTERAWVFTGENGLPVDDQSPRERLQRYATEADIMQYVPKRGKLKGKVWSRANWKMFRNYFISRAAASGMSFVHVMAATGHDSYKMVLHYFRLNEDAYRKDFAKFDSGLTGVDLCCRELTRQSNTQRTHRSQQSLVGNRL